jgi:uncharacterized membrane protein YdjX (TVP38/TMEM64 family)
MKLFLLQLVIFSCFFLFLFIITIQVDVTATISSFINHNSWLSAAISILVLSSDILLPIPSSMVMLLNGKLFGVFTGTCISVIGLSISTLIGFYIGLKSKKRLQVFIQPNQQLEAERLFSKWGMIMLIVSRPIPLLSESISIIAGMHKVSISTLVISTLLGSIPGAWVYAYYGFTSNQVSNQYLGFLLVMAIAALAFILSIIFKNQLNKKHYELL